MVNQQLGELNTLEFNDQRKLTKIRYIEIYTRSEYRSESEMGGISMR